MTVVSKWCVCMLLQSRAAAKQLLQLSGVMFLA